MILRVVKALDWCLTKYASGFQPTVLSKIINLTGTLSKGTGSVFNVKTLEQLGEQLESYNFKKSVIDDIGTETLGPTGASIVRGYIVTCIPLFIRMSQSIKKLKAEGLNEEEIKIEIEEIYGEELEKMEATITNLEEQLKYAKN